MNLLIGRRLASFLEVHIASGLVERNKVITSEKNEKILLNIAKEVDRNPEEITPVHLRFTSISQDHDIALEWLEPCVKWFLVWVSQPPSLLPQILGCKENLVEEDLPQEVVEKYFIVGTPEECVKKVKEFVHSGVRFFVLAIRAPDEKSYFKSLKLYAKEMLPHFKETVE